MTVQKGESCGNKNHPSAQAVRRRGLRARSAAQKRFMETELPTRIMKEQTAKKRNFGGIVVAVIVAVGVISSARVSGSMTRFLRFKAVGRKLQQYGKPIRVMKNMFTIHTSM